MCIRPRQRAARPPPLRHRAAPLAPHYLQTAPRTDPERMADKKAENPPAVEIHSDLLEVRRACGDTSRARRRSRSSFPRHTCRRTVDGWRLLPFGLQEDDEFEEFEEQEWAEGDEDVEDPTMWQVSPCRTRANSPLYPLG